MRLKTSYVGRPNAHMLCYHPEFSRLDDQWLNHFKVSPKEIREFFTNGTCIMGKFGPNLSEFCKILAKFGTHLQCT